MRASRENLWVKVGHEKSIRVSLPLLEIPEGAMMPDTMGRAPSRRKARVSVFGRAREMSATLEIAAQGV